MVAFDAVGPAGGAGQVGTGVTGLTWTHVLSGSATDITIGFSTSTGTPTVSSVTVGGSSASLVSRADINGSSGADGWVYKYRLAGQAGSLPSGSQTVTVTMSSASDMQGSSMSYTGGGAIGTPVIAHNPTGTTQTTVQVTVGTTSSSTIVDMNGAGGSAFSASATTGTARWVANQNPNSAAGNGTGVTAPGTGSNVTPAITFAGGSSDFWGAVAVEIQAAQPVAPPPPPVPAIPPGFMSPMAFQDQVIPPPQPIPPVVTVQASVTMSGSGTLSNTSVGLGVVMSGSGTLSAGPPVITGLGGSGVGYFVDQHGNPRMVLGDAVWALPGNVGRWSSGAWQSDYDTYLSTRAGQGFTVAYTKPMGTQQSGNIDNNGGTFDSLFPFQGGSPSTGTAGANPSTGLTSAYWARIDYFLNSALANGITVFLNAIGYSSDFDSGPGPLAGKSSTEFQAYGAALGARYASQLNLVWMVADDYFGDNDALITAFLTGLRGAGDTHVITIENYPETTSRQDLSTSGATAWGVAHGQFNFCYSYNVTYYGIEKAFAESSPITVIQGDGYFYQGNSTYAGGSGAFAYDRAIRQDAWHALSSGARGWIIGDEAVWQWASTSAASVTNNWYQKNNAGKIRQFMESLSGWQTLSPDVSSQLVTAGRGTHASGFSSGGGGGQYEVAFTDSYVTASRTPDGGSGSSLAVIYLSHGTTITIDQTKMVSGYTATWVDPVSLATSSATAGSTYNSTAKGNNSQGDPDWVLVLSATSAVAGSASLSGLGTLSASPRFESGATLSGTGTLSASPRFESGAALSGIGTLSASPRFQATVALSGQGTLSASFQLQDSATLSGTGTLTSSPAFAGSAALSGLGTLTSSPALAGAATLSGQGTLSASPQFAGAVSMSGTGSLTLALGLQATFSGQGTLSASPRFEAGATLSGLGTLTSSPAFAGSAALSGSGTLSASPQLAGSASLSGSGTLSASSRFESGAALSGTGTLTLALGLQAMLSGVGTLSAIPGGFPSGSSMSGTGTLTAVAQLPSSASLSGIGTLSASPRSESGAALSGAGTLTAGGQFSASVSLSGSGTLTAAGVLQGSVVLSGAGTLTATYGGAVAGSAALSGSGTLVSGYAVVIHASVALSGSGTLASVTVSVGFLATVAAVDYAAYTVRAVDYAAYTTPALDRAAYTTLATDFLP